MFLKVGTVKELEEVKSQLSPEIYKKVAEIVSVLDREYGSGRNVDLNDGGFVAVADSPEAMTDVEKIINVREKIAEWIEPLSKEYINALFVLSNEFSVNIILHKS